MPKGVKLRKRNKQEGVQEGALLSNDVQLTESAKGTIDSDTLRAKTKLSPLRKQPKPGMPKSKCTARNELSENSKAEETIVSIDQGNISHEDIEKENSEILWQPLNWQKMLENIRKMRSAKVAPVDTMGCHKCHDELADKKTQRFQILVALMLSSQTKDAITYQAMIRLKEATLTPQCIAEMKLNVLESILHPVSFYKNKAKYIQQTAKILIEKYNSDIPDDINDLVALPGVGPKMAHICMAAAWHKVTGIGVDVHVHRICNRMGWTPTTTQVPEQTRLAVENWLPRDLWQEVNHLFVGFGQTICTPKKPNCENCLNNDICPFPTSNRKNITNNKSLEPECANSQLVNVLEKVKFKKSKINF